MCVGLCRAGKWLKHQFIEQNIDKNRFVVTARDRTLSLLTFNTRNDFTEHLQRDRSSITVKIDESYFLNNISPHFEVI